MDSGAAGPWVGEGSIAGWTGGSWRTSRSSSTSATGGSGVGRVDGLKSCMGGGAFFLNKEITADKQLQCRS